VTTIAGDTTDIKKGLDSNIGYHNSTNPFAAKFSNPWGICVDDTGNVYVADTYNNVIRKIWVSGGVTTYAGSDSGFAGFVNGPNAKAEFYLPLSLAIDKSGNIYVADNGNNSIREISVSGVVTTVAGTGPTDSTGSYIDGPIDSAAFYDIYGITLGKAGDIYVSQFGSNVNAIRRIYNGRVTTYAGFDTAGMDTDVLSESQVPVGYRNGKNGAVKGDTLITGVLFNGPTGLAFDTSGNLMIADEYNNAIRKFKASDSVVSTFAGKDTVSTFGFLNGVDSLAQFFNPMGLVADKKGNFFVADLGNNVIRAISTKPNFTGVPSITKPGYKLSVYPNPCTDRLNIVSSFNGNAMLLDITGRVVWTSSNFVSPYTLSTSGISPGMYFLRITSESATEISKVEVTR
jgi:sugar lactone lactonase YvrE